MRKLVLLSLLLVAILSAPQNTPGQGSSVRLATAGSTASEREQDGLSGPVRRVRVETARLTVKDGKAVEGSRVLRAITTYDFQGKRIDNVAHPVDSPTPSGKEQYQYDNKGNIIEMVLRGDNGSILSKETYKYEFDELGNWKKMTTSLAVYENGTLGFEPVEVTYRTITYYYNQAIDKLGKPTPLTSNTSSSIPAKEPSALKAESRAANRTSTPAKPAEEKKSASEVSSPQLPNNTPVSSPQPVNNTAAPAGTTHQTVAKMNSIDPPPVPAPQPNTKTEKTESSATKAAQPDVAPGNSTASIRTDVAAIKAKQPDEPKSQPPSTPAPSGATALYEEGVAHLKMGRNQAAVTALKQAVFLDPEDGRSYAKLGIAYAASGQHKEALAAFKLAVRIKPDAMDAEANYRMAESYTGLDKKKEALEAYKQALYTKRAELTENPQSTQFPTMADIHYGLGLAHYNRESFGDAIKELKQAAALETNSVDIQYGLALAYLANGDRSSAQRQEKILRQLDPALADNVAAALSSVTPPGITRVQPREDRRMRP